MTSLDEAWQIPQKMVNPQPVQKYVMPPPTAQVVDMNYHTANWPETTSQEDIEKIVQNFQDTQVNLANRIVNTMDNIISRGTKANGRAIGHNQQIILDGINNCVTKPDIKNLWIVLYTILAILLLCIGVIIFLFCSYKKHLQKIVDRLQLKRLSIEQITDLTERTLNL